MSVIPFTKSRPAKRSPPRLGGQDVGAAFNQNGDPVPLVGGTEIDEWQPSEPLDEDRVYTDTNGEAYTLVGCREARRPVTPIAESGDTTIRYVLKEGYGQDRYTLKSVTWDRPLGQWTLMDLARFVRRAFDKRRKTAERYTLCIDAGEPPWLQINGQKISVTLYARLRPSLLAELFDHGPTTVQIRGKFDFPCVQEKPPHGN